MSGVRQTIEFLNAYKHTEKKLIGEKEIAYLERESREEKFYSDEFPRILLLGRFKSGKSSFINAYMGRELAACDVLEKTSWIARYWPAERDFCYLHMEDGSVEEIELSEFLDKTRRDLFTEEELGKIRRVDVGYAARDKKLMFIDTPGFGTTNAGNESRALDAVKDADFILFFMDVNKIGNLREMSILSKIKEKGVPYLCVANKYDGDIAHHKTISGVREIVREYSDFREEEIVVYSLRQSGNEELEKEKKKLAEILDKIQIHQRVNRENIAIARKIQVHYLAIDLLQKMKQQMYQMEWIKQQFYQNYDYYEEEIRSELAVFLNTYIRSTLYVEYKDAMIQMMSIMIEQNQSMPVGKIMESILPPNYMDNYWKKLVDEITLKYKELWTEKLQLDQKNYALLEDGLSKGAIGKNIDFSMMEQMLDFGHGRDITEKGIKISFGIAGFASFYQAVLGINAAQVMLLGAGITTGLPIALLGMGLTGFFARKAKEERQGKMDIRKIMNEHIENFAESVEKHCLAKLNQVERKIKEYTLGQYENYISAFYPPGRKESQEQEKCNQMLEVLQGEIAGCRFVEDVNDYTYKKLQLTILNLNELTVKIDEYKETLDNLQTEYQNISEKYQNQKQMLDGLQEQNKKYQEQTKILKENSKIYEEDNRKLQAQLEIVEVEKQKYKIQMEDAESEIKGLESEKTNILRKMQGNEIEKEIYEEKLKSIRQELKEIGKKKEKIEQKYQRVQEKTKSLTQEKKELEKENDKNKKELKNQEENLKVNGEKYREIQKKCDGMKKILGKKDIEIQSLQQENGQILEQKNQLERELRENKENGGDSGDIFSKIRMTLEEIRANAENRLVLEEEADKFENLLFLDENGQEEFYADLRGILRDFKMFQDESKKELIKLSMDKANQYEKFLLYRKTYRLYFEIANHKILTISYLDARLESCANYEKYKGSIHNTYSLSDDQIRYKIFDMIASAKKEIMIAVPWMTEPAWENKNQYKESLKNAFFKALQKNPDLKVSFMVGYGSEKDEETKEVAEKIEKEFAAYKNRFHIYQKCVIHIKKMTMDNVCSLDGSYNILSNQAIYDDAVERRAGESMTIKEYPPNVENDRRDICRRAGMIYLPFD